MNIVASEEQPLGKSPCQAPIFNLREILGYQFGQRAAIETAAQSRASLFTGLALVLLTAIPRNYDQSLFWESPLWLFGPLVFSACSGTFLFLILQHGFIRRRFEAPTTISKSAQWRCFISLFWLTAPVAWFYAIPVERFLDSYHAAQANLALLAIVALWRILLMARIISVLQQIKFVRALGWVLVPACLEVILVLFLGLIFGGHLERKIMAGMGGMRNSPEENLIVSALSNVFVGTLVLLPIVVAMLAARSFQGAVPPLPKPAKGPVPVWALGFLAVVWIGLAVAPQLEQYRFVTHARLIEDGKYRESVDYLTRYVRTDFPASRRIEPNPYEYRVWEQLPEIMAILQPTDPEWVRHLYLDDMGVLFSHHWLNCPPTAQIQMFTALERLPEGKAWIQRNRSQLPKLDRVFRQTLEGGDSNPATAQAVQQLKDILRRLGVDSNNLEAPGNP